MVFEELMQLVNRMGISGKNLEKLKSEEYKSAESKILSSRKKGEMIEDINNYDLVSEEDLNKEIHDK